MYTSKSKITLIILCSLFVSIVFYVSQLFYVGNENKKSSQIYVQSLIDSIDRYEFLPLLIAEHHLIQKTLKNPSDRKVSTNENLKSIALKTGADAIYLMDLSGEVIATSNYDSTNSFLHKNYNFRPYFRNAVQYQTRQFYYAKGATTGIPGFFISMPVFIENSLQGIAVVKVELNYWEQGWQNSKDTILVADENNIILLSSEEQWRYRSIGEIDTNTLNTIKSEQQFPGSEHKNIYSKSIQWPSTSLQNNFWFIDNKLFLVNSFSLPKTSWTLYYLQKHDVIFSSSLALFFLLSLLTLLVYYLVKGYKHIAESKRHHELVEIKRKEELQTIIDNIHIGIIITNKSGDILSTNRYAGNLLVDKNLTTHGANTNISHLLKIDEQYQILDQANQTTSGYIETSTQHPTKDPTPVMYSVKNIQIMGNDVYLLTIIDIRKRKKAENEIIKINNQLEDIIKYRTKELEKAQNKLIQQNKISALGNMAATIVHELSQPLTAMNSSIGAINAKIDQKDYNGALASANRLEPLNKKMFSIIQLLKTFSYDDKELRTPIYIEEIVNNTLETYNDLLYEKNIALTIDNKSENCIVNVNPLKMDLVLSNLIKNAIDAMEETTNRCLNIDLKKKNGIACIHITDNGSGMNEINIKQMFSPYFTTKEIGKGLGLGLAICFEIIQEYDGKISANTIDNKTRFSINIPIHKDLRI